MTETELNERIAEITENGDALRQIQSQKDRRRNQRRARNRKNDRRLEIINYGWYAPHIGIIDYGFQGKSLLHSGYHIKYPKNSNFQGWMKKETNKRIRNTNDSISVFSCDEDDVMAFSVPKKLLVDHKCVMRINSKRFVHDIMKSNDLDTSRTYTLTGEYLEDKNIAVFSLVDGVRLRLCKENE